MPDFHIKGDPGQLRSKATQMRSHGEAFNRTADGLEAISTDGWKGRAADRFNDKFEAEPGRWRDAGDGWVRAGGALQDYATAIEEAKRRAAWAEQEYARGERETTSARTAYDTDVAGARKEAADAAARGQHLSLTILPFTDPGQAIRDSALNELGDAKADLKAAAGTCAHEVRAGCHGAPEKRNWLEKAGGAIGSFFKGAAEALVELGKLAAFLANPGVWLLVDMLTDAADGMTAEEIAAKNDLRVEDAGNILQALKDDPVNFGLTMGKALLDWDTWKDDPARALGHLVPDAIIAVVTAGSGTVATRGAKAATDGVDALGDMANAANRLDELADLGRTDGLGDLAKVGDASDLGRLDGPDALSDFLRRYDDIDQPPQGASRWDVDDPRVQSWIDDTVSKHPELDRDGLEGIYDYTTDRGYTAMNGELRSDAPTDPGVQERIDRTNRGLDQLPDYEGTTFRGTDIPDDVLERARVEGQYSDRAFNSSSDDPRVAEIFKDLQNSPDSQMKNPTIFTIEGRSGTPIQPFSSEAGESEILFRPGTEFDVVGDPAPDADGIWRITLRER